jgi:hypothetical protein
MTERHEDGRRQRPRGIARDPDVFRFAVASGMGAREGASPVAEREGFEPSVEL